MTDAPKKMPGMLHDSWRTPQATEQAPPIRTRAKVAAGSETTPTYADNPEDSDGTAELCTITLKGYGAITFGRASTTTGAAGRMLEFAVGYRKDLEEIFTEYGVVVAQMSTQAVDDLKFYIQRKDGWVLAIPGAGTRDEGCLQLIQALLKMVTVPALKKKLEDAKISVYKF